MFPQTRPDQISVNAIDDNTWGAAAYSVRAKRCYLIGTAAPYTAVCLRGAPCVGLADAQRPLWMAASARPPCRTSPEWATNAVAPFIFRDGLLVAEPKPPSERQWPRWSESSSQASDPATPHDDPRGPSRGRPRLDHPALYKLLGGQLAMEGIKPKDGDVFEIPIDDGRVGYGQVVGQRLKSEVV